MHDCCTVHRVVIASDDFLPDEVELATLLGGAVVAVASDTLRAYDRVISDSAGHANIQKFDTAIEAAGAVASKAYTRAVRDQTEEVLTRTMYRGSRYVGSEDIIRDIPSRVTVLRGMTDSAGYFTNNYFNREVVPALYAEVANIFDSPAQIVDGAFDVIRQKMADRLKTVPYWRVVANAAASRGYHYGVLKAAEATGKRGFVLHAKLDAVTSKLCRFLHGTEFWVADALQIVERWSEAKGEDVKDITPWVKQEDIEGMDTTALRDAGIMVPPFHGNCRTTIRLI